MEQTSFRVGRTGRDVAHYDRNVTLLFRMKRRPNKQTAFNGALIEEDTCVTA